MDIVAIGTIGVVVLTDVLIPSLQQAGTPAYPGRPRPLTPSPQAVRGSLPAYQGIVIL